MTIRELVRGLGGGRVVAAQIGVTPAAVSHWVGANVVPAGRQVALWRMAVAAGLAWQPPGADEIRDRLAQQPATEAA
jgi:hypothetical protein